MITIKWAQFKQIIQSGIYFRETIDSKNNYQLFLLDNTIPFQCLIPIDTEKNADQIDYETNFQSSKRDNLNIPKSSSAFASKKLEDGKSIFKRVHGVQKTLTSSTDTIEIVVPYVHAKINGLEIHGANHGDTANFNVYDNPAGTISGFPNVKLNQFGFDVNITAGLHREDSNYDADLIQGMKLEIEFTGTIGQLIGVNFILHEIK